MARWRLAKDEDELRARMPRTHPTIWRRAVKSERVQDALRLKRGELELRRFLQAENATFQMRAFGRRRPGGRPLLKPERVLDGVSAMRWVVFGGPASEPPIDVDLEDSPQGEMIVLRVAPWVTTRSVARLFALFRKLSVVDPRARIHEKNLALYQVVTNWRKAVPGTWAEAMNAWNDFVTRDRKPWPKYAHVSNFHRDYQRVKRILEARSRRLESASRSALAEK